MSETHDSLNDIAIIGMDARVPGAASIDEYWDMLRGGREAVKFFADAPQPLGAGMAYVRAAPILDGIDLFDARFFGFNPREAETMDPQIRLFLESSWTALESANCDPKTCGGRIGIFGGSHPSSYLALNLSRNVELMESAGGGPTTLHIMNDRDTLAMIASYKLDLTGPSVTVQTFCSTSLVAVHLACQSLLNGESDVALAGGVTINHGIHNGYVHLDAGMLSADGHTRTFDERGSGTVFGNGVGVVVLKRLQDALADGDNIRAVIRGTAVNNDGAQKGGFTAPSVIGQSKAIAEAMAIAQVSPESIGYVEAHGTATAIGDPIEIEALTRAFATDKKGFCAIGSVKSNIGHLDRAAGVISLIKTVLTLENRQIPPSLHFENPNPRIDFESSPFRVNTALCDWTANGTPRRAGVSALGVGGTNAHAVLQEAPPREPSGPSRECQLLVLSAQTQTALQKTTDRLIEHLRSHPDLPLADLAHTLRVGRRQFSHRRAVVVENAAHAIDTLESLPAQKAFTAHSQATDRPVVFMFSGQGSQYVNMARGLYESEPVFAGHLDDCIGRLRVLLGFDLKEVLFPSEGQAQAAIDRLNQTAVTQPALFAVEYATAKLWMSWGVLPESMIGHSVGEYVAAHLAGVLSLDDALALVAERGRLMQSMSPGSMLAVPLPADELQGMIQEPVALAAANGPSLSVASGPSADIDALEARLQQQDVPCTRLHTSHAFHSSMMDPMLDAFGQRLKSVTLRAPSVRYVSNLTGTWITAEQATDPAYWTAHLRQAVRFSDGVQTLWNDPDRVLLEVGPGSSLTTLARQQAKPSSNVVTLASIRHPRDGQGDGAFLMAALGRLWIAGARIDWQAFTADEKRQRVSLPTYPFERERYWIDPSPRADAPRRLTGKNPDPASWFYTPAWHSLAPAQPFERTTPAEEDGTWLAFVPSNRWGLQVTQSLAARGHDVVTVTTGDAFDGHPGAGYAIDPESAGDYEALLADLETRGRNVTRIVHAWSVVEGQPGELTDRSFAEAQRTGFYSVLRLAKALARRQWTRPLQLKILTARLFDVFKREQVSPENAPLLAMCKVIPQEHSSLLCAAVDVESPDAASWDDPNALDQLAAELAIDRVGTIIAFRRGQRWVQTFDRVAVPAALDSASVLRQHGAYLIVGGLGGVGFALASYLAKAAQARLVLTGRSTLPPRAQWKAWIDSRGFGDTTSIRIARVVALEQMGAEVLLLGADAGNVDEMRTVIQQAEAQFGTLRGVIYAAGVVTGNSFRPIEQLEPVDCAPQFHPKVTGLLALDKALDGKDLDFCLLTSSLSSVLGGLGYAAYSAANLFEDAYTRQRNQRGGSRWISVNWDEWRLTEQQGSTKGLAQFSMSPMEGGEAFGRILALRGVNEVVVSTGDLQGRIEQWIKLEGLRESATAAERKPASTRYPRPNLQNAYVAPGNPTEQKIAETWQDLLGIEQVGVHDNFFELGGHSMLGLQLVSRIKAQFTANISIATLFEGPTVHSLSTIISQREAGEEPTFDTSHDRGQRRKERSRERSQREGEMAAEQAAAGAGGVAVDAELS